MEIHIHIKEQIDNVFTNRTTLAKKNPNTNINKPLRNPSTHHLLSATFIHSNAFISAIFTIPI